MEVVAVVAVAVAGEDSQVEVVAVEDSSELGLEEVTAETRWMHSKKVAFCNSERELSSGTSPAVTLILDLQPPEL
ncbi:hypothetical protein QTO34_003048 [Cnephaeus nilssonii]|uniref:Uncharacterized protein n=1 Tax=Cnephaeus nilssonii TaxID=3371016 RepID=A0AA40LMN2_CNENI|nr:hypothetical protein QTO34_003048 [Eptesicus nilssonii]